MNSSSWLKNEVNLLRRQERLCSVVVTALKSIFAPMSERFENFDTI